MPPEANDAAFLQDMAVACDRVARFIAGKSLEDYRHDDFLRSAVERQVEIIGEAARQISAATQTANPQVQWRPIIAQRHILAHEYGEIEHSLIWKVASVHVAALRKQLAVILPPDL